MKYRQAIFQYLMNNSKYVFGSKELTGNAEDMEGYYLKGNLIDISCEIADAIEKAERENAEWSRIEVEQDLAKLEEERHSNDGY